MVTKSAGRRPSSQRRISGSHCTILATRQLKDLLLFVVDWSLTVLYHLLNEEITVQWFMWLVKFTLWGQATVWCFSVWNRSSALSRSLSLSLSLSLALSLSLPPPLSLPPSLSLPLLALSLSLSYRERWGDEVVCNQSAHFDIEQNAVGQTK